MPLLNDISNFIKTKTGSPAEKNASKAYDLWSAKYDEQPDNLMLNLDEQIFSKLLYPVEIKNKFVVDIGCGTGRHWEKVYAKQPEQLAGYDVSDGMLKKLKQRYPDAKTSRITNDIFSEVADASYDLIISTLTVAHIQHIKEAIKAWCRILKKSGDIIITDFHPDMLAMGGKRTFVYKKKSVSIKNYIHSLNSIKALFYNKGFTIKTEEIRYVNESVKEYYRKQNALDVFECFKGIPIIYGIHFKR